MAAAVLITGFGVLAVFANGTAILEALEAHFPPHAFVPGMGFFTLGGILLLALLCSARRQAAEASRWPVIGGASEPKTLLHFRTLLGCAPPGRRGTFFAQRVAQSYPPRRPASPC